MPGKCAYLCGFHRGKVEWHHPISTRFDVGFILCEAHHSLLMGRKKRYIGEIGINKTLAEMRAEIKDLEAQVVIKAGLQLSDIDKH